MRWLLCVVAMLGVCGVAAADTRTIARVGGWTAFGGTLRNGTPTCGIDTHDAPTGRHFLLQYVTSDPRRITVRVVRESWSIPEQTEVPVRLAIDGQPGWTATATGAGREVTWHIAANTLDRFEVLFRRGMTMRVEFAQGSEPPWTFNLLGTNAIMNSFVDCLAALQSDRAPTQPFAAPAQPFGGATQPFDAFAPAPRSDGPAKGPP